MRSGSRGGGTTRSSRATGPQFGTEAAWERETVDLEEQVAIVARVERGLTPVPAPEEAAGGETPTNAELFWDWEG